MSSERKPGIPNPAIPPGSTILVTGANGLISTHCVEQAILAGYKVRGTVRGTSRCSWVAEHFHNLYGSDSLSLFQVPDVYSPGYLDEAVKGCTAIIHTVPTAPDFGAEDPNPATKREIDTVIYALEVAAKESCVKRFVLTTSAWCAGTHPANTPYEYDETSYNEDCIKRTYHKDPEPANGLEMFEAIKTRMEQEAWAWVKEHNPNFVFNTVLPYCVMGRVIEPFKQSLRTTGARLKVLYDGGPEHILEFHKLIGPCWYIDTEDTGKLHLIAVIDPSVENERIFGHADHWTSSETLEILRKLFPDRKFIDNFDPREDIGKVPNERGNELLKKHYGKGWKGLQEIVEENMKSFNLLS